MVLPFRVRTYLNNVLSLFQLEWDGSDLQVTLSYSSTIAAISLDNIAFYHGPSQDPAP